MTLGLIPAAGAGSRIQPLAFSKELLPVGSRVVNGVERPRAVAEYVVERMLIAGATRIGFVIAPGKADIVEYFGARVAGADVFYVVQQHPAGLCDAVFRARPFVQPDEPVLLGLPDTVWFPADGLLAIREEELGLLCFPVDRPELFDAVVADDDGEVREIQVKTPGALSRWVWGAIAMRGGVLAALDDLWQARDRRDEYLGTLVNAHLARGGRARALRRGEAYVDVGTLHGYREAIRVLAAMSAAEAPSPLP